MSKISVPEIPFDVKPSFTIEFTAKEILGAYINSLQGDRSAMIEIEKVFGQHEFYNAVLYHGKKIVGRVSRTGQPETSLLHTIIGELTRHKVSKVVFAAYDGLDVFPCNVKNRKKRGVK